MYSLHTCQSLLVLGVLCGMSRTLNTMPTKKGRIAVTLEDDVYQWIVERASNEGRPLANLAAFLLTRAVKEEMGHQNDVNADEESAA